MSAVAFSADDGYPLSGDLYLPTGPVRGAVVIASAMAVRAKLYKYFALFLASRGLATLTFDYRGIDRSVSGNVRSQPEITLTDWGARDLPAAIRLMRQRFPQTPVLHVGHSIGGQLLGLSGEPVDASLLIAAQAGFFRHWPAVKRPLLWLYWHLMPTVARVAGYLPMRGFQQGEDVPLGAALQWARWGTTPTSVQAGLSIPIRAYAFSDDFYAPVGAVKALLAQYARCATELVEVTPQSLNVTSVGHFGIFRREFEPTLWTWSADWLLDRAARGA